MNPTLPFPIGKTLSFHRSPCALSLKSLNAEQVRSRYNNMDIYYVAFPRTRAVQQTIGDITRLMRPRVGRG